MDITPANMQGIDTGFVTVFNERLTGVEVTWDKVAMRVGSATRANSYPKIQDVAGMRKWLGDRVVKRAGGDSFQIVNDLYEDTVAVPRTDVEDDQYGIHNVYIQDMGRAAAELPDELIWPLVASGFDTVGHDGQYFFDTDHPVELVDGSITSVSNDMGGSGEAWFLMDMSRAIRPFIFQDRTPPEFVSKTGLTDEGVYRRDEFEWGARRRCGVGFGAWQLAIGSRQTLDHASYEAARAAGRAMIGHGGRKLNTFANDAQTLLVVPASLEGKAREVLMAERTDAGATNVWRGTAELHVENRL